jgi:hypothetical protein
MKKDKNNWGGPKEIKSNSQDPRPQSAPSRTKTVEHFMQMQRVERKREKEQIETTRKPFPGIKRKNSRCENAKAKRTQHSHPLKNLSTKLATLPAPTSNRARRQQKKIETGTKSGIFGSFSVRFLVAR